ncbi:hypothetical protein BDR06DRAFT_968190 [Suillus hirtellus]|nr:hypothetical protein BDR06DRAFT_968190 [Suillus hirtellus]
MAEVHANEININEDNHHFHGEVEEQAGDAIEEQAGDAMEEQVGVEEQAEDMEHAGNFEHAGDLQHTETFTAMQSAIALWDYAQEIIQDDMQFAQTHPHAPCPAHPPIQMLRRNKCLLQCTKHFSDLSE